MVLLVTAKLPCFECLLCVDLDQAVSLNQFLHSPSRWGWYPLYKDGEKKMEVQLFSKVTNQDGGRKSGTFPPCRPTIPILYAIIFFEEVGI